MNAKTAVCVVVAVIAIAAVAYAAYTLGSGDNAPEDDTPSPDVTPTPTPTPSPTPSGGDDDTKILVAYFSRTNTTERYAQQIASITGADTVRIQTVNPYPDDYTATTEVARDELNDDARPEISTVVDDMSDYDVIFIGYPIWWGAPPMAVLTFLEDYDLSGKTVVTFCTSASSSIAGSTGYIRGSADGAEVIEGLRMTSSTDVAGWISGLGLGSARSLRGGFRLPKNVLVISGSPRRGNSDMLCDEFVRGAEESGNRVEKIELRKCKVGFCTACYRCRDTGKPCHIKDDVPGIIAKMEAADVIVLASPVYFYSIDAQMKALIDRTVSRWRDIRDKTFYYIVTSAEDSDTVTSCTVECMRGLAVCLDGSVEGGIVEGKGVYEAGEIEGSLAMKQAYEMGKGCRRRSFSPMYDARADRASSSTS